MTHSSERLALLDAAARSRPAYRLLPDADWLEIGGRDALPYLQTKLTQDVRRWGTTGGARATAVDIRGALVFEGEFRTGGGAVQLLGRSGTAAAAMEHLEHWVIREDVTFRDRTGEAVQVVLSGTPGEVPPFAAEGSAGLGGGFLPLRVGGEVVEATRQTIGSVPAWRLLVAPSALPAVEAALRGSGWSSLDDEGWRLRRFLWGRPEAPDELVPGETIPIEAGLWDAMASNKGCYLGQEVIERLWSRGQPNRRMWRVALPEDAPADGGTLTVDEEEAGRLFRTVGVEGARVGFAMLRRKFQERHADVRFAGYPVEVINLVGAT